MPGSILGRDQIARVNAAYPALVAHIQALLAADGSAYGRMRVHCSVEALDTTELYAIFSPLSFLSPAEKRAMVRAAVYDVLSGITAPALVFAPRSFTDAEKAALDAARPVSPADEMTNQAVDAVRVFNPPQFKLNVATAKALAETLDATPVSAKTANPVVSTVQDMKNRGAEEAKAQQAVRDAAVAKLRESAAPVEIEPATGDPVDAVMETETAPEE